MDDRDAAKKQLSGERVRDAFSRSPAGPGDDDAAQGQLPENAARARSPQCGGCARFVPIDRRCQVSGRCRLGIRPGIISRATTGCGVHRDRGTPAQFQRRPVRA